MEPSTNERANERCERVFDFDPFSDGDDRSQLGRKRAEVDDDDGGGDVYRNEEPLKEDDGGDGDDDEDFSQNFSVSFAVSKRRKKVIKATPDRRPRKCHAAFKMELRFCVYGQIRDLPLNSRKKIIQLETTTFSRPSDSDVTFTRDSLVGDRVTTRSPKHHLYSGKEKGRTRGQPLSPSFLPSSLPPFDVVKT